MKSTRPLVVALSVSLLSATSLLGAEPPKKSKAPTAPPAKATEEPKPAKAPEESKPAEAGSALPAVVAVVEGVEIKGPELEKTFVGFLASRQIPGDALPAPERARGYRMILEEMIKEKLVETRAAAVKVSEEEVNATFQKFTANLGPEAEVMKQIEASGQTVESIRENIRASLKQDHWLESEVDKAGGVADKEAEDFYKKNTEKFVSQAEVRASHILLRVPPEAKPEVVVEKEKAAQAIAARVKKGEDFAKLAKELSEDPSAKQNSGDLDFFKHDQMVPEFADVAFGMKTGEISDPVRSQFGYHVIKVTDRHESETMALEKVKPKLVAYLKVQKVEALKQEIRDKAEVKINLPEPPPEALPPAAPAPAAP
ncbi:MAG: peptidyl-prolyl cis-trans isomerase [Chthoniobacter sp.]|jgi:parvulin-like peptidyl-prolyl isomerase|nr:peptidyl-prolyl cis-trans isomerase [Chthoniobacter sp.]